MILSSHARLINFAQNALGVRNFGQQNELQNLQKILGYLKSGIQILYKVEQFSSLFWG